jgi:hypothetical protein
MTVEQQIDMYLWALSVNLSTPDGAVPSHDQCLAQLNRAQERVAKRIYWYDPNITVTLTANIGAYNKSGAAFSSRILRLMRAWVNGTEIAVRPFQHFEQEWPDWRTSATPATPQVVTAYGSTILYHVPPDAACVAAAGNKAAALALPAAMVAAAANTTECALPIEAHEAVVFLAAVLAAHPASSDEVSFRLMADYSRDAGDVIDTLRFQNYPVVFGELGETKSSVRYMDG